MTTAERFANEVVDLHRFFQDWFNGAVPKSEKVFRRVEVAWPEPFTLVDPKNGIHASASLLRDTFNLHGAFPELRIQIRALAISEIPDTLVAVARYEEWHVDENETEGRMCSATLLRQSEASAEVRWVHIHESKLKPVRDAL